MQKIIVATDYAESADNAVEYGLSLANSFGALLSLVSAVDEPYSSSAGALVDIKQHIREEAMTTMEQVERDIRPRLTNNARVDRHTVDGDPGPTIARVAKAQGYDLIVMGTRGSDAARELFTGSVANSLIKNTALPVVVVPKQVAFRPIRRILLAVDDQTLKSGELLRPLRSIAQAYDAEIIVFHDDVEGDGPDYDPKLPEYLSGVNHRFEVRSGESDSVRDSIERAVKFHDADLLAMVYHDRGFLARMFNESTVSKVVFNSPAALLVLQDH